MVLPPLKYTCMPCFLHTFLLSLRPFVYGTTIYVSFDVKSWYCCFLVSSYCCYLLNGQEH